MRAASAFALAVLSASAVASCGSQADSAAAAACKKANAEACGASCKDDSGCPAGLYCSAGGKCAADCTPNGAECGSGMACTARGRCGDGDLGLGGGSSMQSSGAGNACADVNVNVDRVTPTVMLLIDQSGSMTSSFGNGTRWSVLHDALMSPTTGLVKTLQNEVRFGLALYTSHGGNAGGVCPILTEVEVALGNYDAIRQKYDAARPDRDTPTAESLTAVAAQLAQVTEAGPKVIVLATDGEPDTCENPNDQMARQPSIAAAQGAYAKGIKSFIISVGAEIALSHLQDMANAGAGLPVGGTNNAPYYRALDQQSLIDAFNKIIGGVRTCVFTLNGKVTGDPATGTVLLDGHKLPYGDPNGWKLNNPSEIELVGQACADLQNGAHKLNVSFPCGSITNIQ